MHSCPVCDQACACDQEDAWNECPADCLCKRRCEREEAHGGMAIAKHYERRQHGSEEWKPCTKEKK